MTTYYQDRSVLITSTAIRVGDRWYRLADLDDVWLERGTWQADRALAVLVMRVLVAAAAVALVAAIVALAFTPHDPGHGRLPNWAVWGYLFASPMVLGVLVVGAERTRERGLRPLLLCAWCRGEEITLFTTTNARRFGQVHRAVLRALEHRVR
jgi:hypothetical protein